MIFWFEIINIIDIKGPYEINLRKDEQKSKTNVSRTNAVLMTKETAVFPSPILSFLVHYLML